MDDIVYLHQALKQDDFPKFIKAIVKKVNSLVDEKHWEPISWFDISLGIEVVPSVWAIRCNQDLTANQVTKNE